MPQTCIEKREEARKMYVESGGKLLVKDIAAHLNVPRTTVVGWKKKDCWDKGLRRKPKDHRADNSKGKKNAAGPHPSQQGNKHALVHGRYEEIKYQTMTDEEKELADAVREKCKDPEQILIELITDLSVREVRISGRIDSLKKDGEKAEGKMITRSYSRTRKGIVGEKEEEAKKRPVTQTTQGERVEDVLLAQENALTGVQQQKHRAIISLHKLYEDRTSREREEQRIAMEQKRLELMERRLELIDPNTESEAMQEARELLGGIESAF